MSPAGMQTDDAAQTAAPVLAGRLPDPPAVAGIARVTARRAESTALNGELDEALRLADEVIADPTAADRAHAAMVAAAVLAHRGLLARSAELYRWLTSARLGSCGSLAAVALLGTGELDEARRVLEQPDTADRPPTLLAGAEALMARGMHESVSGSATVALSSLTRAAALLEPSGDAVLLPDTPAALAGLVALQVGHFDVAESVLERALACGLGGPLARTRHRLLLTWSAMLRGDHAHAHQLLDDSTPDAGRLEPRDELLAAALQVGLARREGELRALHDAWRRAKEALVRHPVDLLALLPLGELIVGAARLREQHWVAPHLAQAQALLERLGDPPLWATPLHWHCLHAAIMVQQPQEAERHAEALADAAEHGPYPATLATAALSWVHVVAGRIDAADVESAARGLHESGLRWEGSRLAGQAAIRTTSRKEATALLALARSLHSPPARAPATSAQPREGDSASAAPTAGPAGVLTEREKEIATLLLTGLTYKQIGERLFISAKTVEHHVARMRQRLGSDDRAGLLARLRDILDRERR